MAFAGVAISLLLFYWLQTREQQYLETRFQLDAKDRTDSIQRAVADRLGTVRAVSAFFAGPGLVTREEFRDFTQPLLATYEGVRSLAWVPRVPWAQRPAHEQAIRETGLADYKISQWNAAEKKLVAAEKRNVYYPVLFIEPENEFPNYLGRDLRVYQACYAAFQKAMDTGAMSASVARPPRKTKGEVAIGWSWPIRFGTNTPRRSNVLEIIPKSMVLFWDFSRLAPSRKRPWRFSIRWASTCIFMIPPEKTTRGLSPSSSHPCTARTRTWSHRRKNPVRLRQGLRFTTSFAVANRHWTIDCFPMDVYFTRQRTWGPAGALLAGLLVTGLLVGYLVLLTGHTARVERLVNERTRRTPRKRATIPPPRRQRQRRFLPPRHARTHSGRQQVGVRQLGIHARGVAVDDHRRHRRGLHSRRISDALRRGRPRNIP